MTVTETEKEIRTSTGVPALPRVNLLPPELLERRQFRRVQAGLGAGLLAAAGVVALLAALAHTEVGSAHRKLAAEQADQGRLQRQVSDLSNVSQVYAKVSASQAMLTQAMGREVQWSHYLNDLSLTIPDHVWVTNLTVAQTDPAPAPAGAAGAATGIGTVTISGVGFSHNDVGSWLESLAAQKGYSNPYFSNSIEALIGSQPTVNFSSTVTVTPDAYSQRYTKPFGG